MVQSGKTIGALNHSLPREDSPARQRWRGRGRYPTMSPESPRSSAGHDVGTDNAARRRRPGTHPPGRPAGMPLSDDEAAGDEGPEDVTMRGEMDRLLARGLATLSPGQRAVVELTFYQGCSYAEIAEITRAPVNTVKTRMFHARRRLAPLLTALGLASRPAAEEKPAPEEQAG